MKIEKERNMGHHHIGALNARVLLDAQAPFIDSVKVV
jgi:hypothetical protein